MNGPPMRTRALLLLCLLAPSCVSLDRPAADKRRFLLEATRTTAQTPAPLGHLLVRTFHAQAPWAGPGFVTRMPGGAVETDFYQEWFAPIGAQVGEMTRRWLAASGLFATVTGDGSQVHGTHLLEGDLLELSIDRRGDAPAAVLRLEVVVLNSDRSVTLHAVLEQRQALRDLEPATVVAAWQAGLSAALSELETKLRAALATK